MSALIRVFVFDPVRVSGEAIGHVLRGRRRVVIVGTGCEVGQACGGPEAADSDLILVRAEGNPAAAVVRAIRAACPGRRIVVIGVEDRPSDIVRLIEAGASGYVPQGATPDELGRAVEAIFDSTFACPPHVTLAVFDRVCELAGTAGGTAEADRLSGRERQIVDMIARGLSNKEIARELRLALHTVKNHVHRILAKLHVRRRRDAARAALPQTLPLVGLNPF